jgi:hypothetical protein
MVVSSLFCLSEVIVARRNQTLKHLSSSKGDAAMKIQLKRAIVLLPGMIGIVYGVLSMLRGSVTIHATARCCSGASAECADNQYCADVTNLTACGPGQYNYCVSVAN